MSQLPPPATKRFSYHWWSEVLKALFHSEKRLIAVFLSYITQFLSFSPGTVAQRPKKSQGQQESAIVMEEKGTGCNCHYFESRYLKERLRKTFVFVQPWFLCNQYCINNEKNKGFRPILEKKPPFLSHHASLKFRHAATNNCFIRGKSIFFSNYLTACMVNSFSLTYH